MKKIIFVLGMHRSGTSYLAQAMGHLGGVLPSTLGAPGEDNLDGYFEPLNIVSIHDEIFSSQNMSWLSIRKIPVDWFYSDEADYYKKLLIKEFNVAFEDQELVVFKDPRTCKLIPLWLDIIEECGWEACFLITVRNPSEVASSLFKRNGLDSSYSEALWLSYNECLEDYLKDKNKIVLNFPNWVDAKVFDIYEFVKEFSEEQINVGRAEFKAAVAESFKEKYINNVVDFNDRNVDSDPYTDYYYHLLSGNFSDVELGAKLRNECKEKSLMEIGDGYMNLVWELSRLLKIHDEGSNILSPSYLVDKVKHNQRIVKSRQESLNEVSTVVSLLKFCESSIGEIHSKMGSVEKKMRREINND